MAWTLATFFGCGFLRPGPGTWASAITALIWYVTARNGPSSYAHLLAGAGAAVAILVGIPAASVVARESGRNDPSIVVIDEVAGQLLPLIVAPANWKYLFISFILFRGFDILKPAPVRQLERLPGGLGIMLDDLAAGVYALLGVALLMHFQVL